MAPHYALPNGQAPQLQVETMQSNPFWEYSLAVYRIDRVRDILLHWQDDFGCDVNMVLCCCWLASKRQRLDREQCSRLLEAGARWRAQCLLPLRSVRRFVREQAHSDSLYRQIKAAELGAEQWQQQCLFDCTERFAPVSQAGADGVGMENLQIYCQLLSDVEWRQLLEEATELLALLKL